MNWLIAHVQIMAIAIYVSRQLNIKIEAICQKSIMLNCILIDSLNWDARTYS